MSLNEKSQGRTAVRKWHRMMPFTGVVYALLRHLEKKRKRAVLVVPGKKDAEEAMRCVEAFGGKGFTSSFPHYELNPYEHSSPDPKIVSQRIETLKGISKGKVSLVVTTAEGFSSFTIPPEILLEKEFRVIRGQEADREELVNWLGKNGFERIPEVSDPGDFALRGGIIDCYPPGTPLPVRIEFNGDRVESVRLFDPPSQRTVEWREEAILSPVSEVIEGHWGGEEDELPASVCSFIREGIRSPGVEFQLPRIYGKVGFLTDYFGDDPEVVFYNYTEVEKRCRFLSELAHSIWKGSGDDFPPPEELWISPGELGAISEKFSTRAFDLLPGSEVQDTFFGYDLEFPTQFMPSGVAFKKIESAVSLVKDVRRDGWTVLFTARGEYRLQVLGKLLREHEIFPLPMKEGEEIEGNGSRLYFIVSGIKEGFIEKKEGLLVLTEGDILGKRAISPTSTGKRRKKEHFHDIFGANDYIVHDDYGIGQFKGLERKKVGGNIADFGVIEYSGGDLLYLPVTRFDLIQRYRGGERGDPLMDRLGGKKWQATKKKVKARVQKIAAELLSIYAAREMSHTPPFPEPDGVYEEFAGDFEFEETPDQERAIKEVMDDLTGKEVMDRLVCGDVGYGKTEVALRAAFLTAMSGKQVALLCPTTVLAEQHLRTFTRRFEKFPVQVEALSRFVQKEDQDKVLKGLEGGTVDIVIGTHRLLQGDLEFRELGLLIVDEEQKFGVMHKEKLKKLRPSVNILTLTATPIPRTLNIALSGIRDISIISTPPRERLSIRNFVVPFSEDIVREAVGRELRRGGQVYFIHNRVQTIGRVERFLREAIPTARIEVAHGQMNSSRLESIMGRFYRGEIDLLLSTAIVESGLDVPRANTIIVDRAHTFGLAQLYQLRGRVGRERKRAYAYFIMPPREKCSGDALSRLSAIEELDELGSGFQLASQDLDIRGAGDILGPHQSGHIQNVGYSMYLRFLEEAVEILQEKERKQWILPDVHIPVSAYIPDEYIRDERGKLEAYRKISLIRSYDEYEAVAGEIEDRYGPCPPPVKHFLKVSILRASLAEVGVKELKVGRGKMYISFIPESPVDRRYLAGLITRGDGVFGFDRRGRFYRATAFDGLEWNVLLTEINEVLGEQRIMIDESSTGS